MIDPDLFGAFAGAGRETDRIYGVVIGLVTSNHGDPAGLGRVKVKFPWLSEEHGSHWARVISPMAGNDRGLYMLPEVGDEVLVAFEHGHVGFPCVLGSLWNGKDKPPGANDGKNNVRLLKSRSGHVVRLDDTAGKEKIEIADAKGTQSIVFDTAAGTLTITADQDLVIESKSGLLKLSGNKGVEIMAPEGVGKLEAGQSLDLKSSGGQVNVKGKVINLN